MTVNGHHLPSVLTSAIPVLHSDNLDATIKFYETLDFKLQFRSDRLIGLNRDRIRLHFWLDPDTAQPTRSTCRIMLQSIESLYQLCQQLQIIAPNGQLAEKPWRTKEFIIEDCHRNLIWFIEPVQFIPGGTRRRPGEPMQRFLERRQQQSRSRLGQENTIKE